jgi:cytochrome c oxidase subunit 3
MAKHQEHSHSHPYHLVNPSPWPFLGAASAFLLTLGGAQAMHGHPVGLPLVVLGAALVLYTMYVWWRDVVKEAENGVDHTPMVQRGLRAGMVLFIVSEIMFFAAFFWAFFNASLLPKEPLTDTWAIAAGVWPPKDIVEFDPFHLPLLNTLILLLSGTTVTWAHYSVLHNDRKGLVQGLFWTVVLGFLFTCVQAYEYSHAAFGFTQGVYASTFYLATGFHGVHVLIGTIFLLVCLLRARKGQFTAESHLGLEFAAWYWHFVDVVWLFLFVCVYGGLMNSLLPLMEAVFTGTNIAIGTAIAVVAGSVYAAKRLGLLTKSAAA